MEKQGLQTSYKSPMKRCGSLKKQPDLAGIDSGTLSLNPLFWSFHLILPHICGTHSIHGTSVIENEPTKMASDHQKVNNFFSGSICSKVLLSLPEYF